LRRRGLYRRRLLRLLGRPERRLLDLHHLQLHLHHEVGVGLGRVAGEQVLEVVEAQLLQSGKLLRVRLQGVVVHLLMFLKI
jgi:hypothetical protein